jgi:hypothetical protein
VFDSNNDVSQHLSDSSNGFTLDASSSASVLVRTTVVVSSGGCPHIQLADAADAAARAAGYDPYSYNYR